MIFFSVNILFLSIAAVMNSENVTYPFPSVSTYLKSSYNYWSDIV